MRFLIRTGLIVAALLLLPATASAATCSDYSSQAAAQRAADTRDADGDGVYCESLPCPCAGRGQSSGGGGSSSPAPRPRPAPKPKPKPRRRAQVISARITSVIDGDTVNVRAFGAKRSFYKVRLIGIDTPESRKPATPVECGAKRATGNMLRLGFTDPSDDNGDGVLDTRGGEGRRVTLTTDPTQDVFDRFGRLLAYVTTRSGTLLQTAQLSDGWAQTYVFAGTPFQRVNRFRAAERRARASGRGVWTRCGGNFHRP